MDIQSENSKKYLDIEGLTYFRDKINEKFQDKLDKGSNIEITDDNEISVLGYTYDLERDTFIEGTTNSSDGASLNSHAEGKNTQVVGNASHSEGNSTQAIGNYSHAEGDSTIGDGTASHAEGQLTNAGGNYSHTEGIGTKTQNPNEHAEGSYNKTNAGSDDASNTTHSVGIGTSDTDRKNAFEIMQNGDTYLYGIGGYNGTNAALVEEQTKAKTLQETINNIENSTKYTAGENINIENNVITAKGYNWNDSTSIMTVDGQINATNGFFETSDERKKNVISDISLEKAYDMITNCQSILYTLKDNPDKQQIGLIAQEVQEFFPEIISTDSDGYLSLDYSKLTVILFRVLKDLIKRVSAIENN